MKNRFMIIGIFGKGPGSILSAPRSVPDASLGCVPGVRPWGASLGLTGMAGEATMDAGCRMPDLRPRSGHDRGRLAAFPPADFIPILPA